MIPSGLRVGVVFLFLTLLLSAICHGGQTFFVKPNGTEDSRGIIQTAINQAIQAGPGSEVKLGPGRFFIRTPIGERWCFSASNANELTIGGEAGKTELVIGNPASGGFFFADANKVALKNITIDYDPVPFTQGLVISVDRSAGCFELEIEAGYPSPSETWFHVKPPYNSWGLIFEAHARQLKAGVSDCLFIDSWSPVESGKWRFKTKPDETSKLSTIAPGDRFAFMARGGDGVCLFANCHESGIENVTVHASPSLTIALLGCSQMKIERLAIQFRPNTSRLLASNGDGIHCERNRIGPIIQGCQFEGMADDGINIYAPPIVVQKVLAPDRVQVQSGCDINPNDLLQIFDPRRGRILGETKAIALKNNGPNCEVSLEKPIAGIIGGPDHRQGDTIYNLSACGRDYLIRDNHFRLHRRHGALLRAGNGVVENNTFENNGGLGVVVTNEPDWPEGPLARNVTIRNNTFIGGGYAAGYGDSPIGAALMIRGTGLGRLAEDRVLSHIKITSNTFMNPPGAAIYVGAAENVAILHNQVLTSGTNMTMRSSAAVILEHCAQTHIDDLVVRDSRSQRLAALQIQSSVASGTEGVSIGKINARLAPDRKAVLDERPK